MPVGVVENVPLVGSVTVPDNGAHVAVGYVSYEMLPLAVAPVMDTPVTVGSVAVPLAPNEDRVALSTVGTLTSPDTVTVFADVLFVS